MFKRFSPVVNAVVKLLLRSPLQRVLGRRLLLITFTGRRSGRSYTTPTRYIRDGADIVVFSERSRRWWRNLEGGAPVQVRVAGETLRGTGWVVPPDQRLLARDQQSVFQAARRLITRRSAEQIAANRVIIRIVPESSGRDQPETSVR